MGRVITDELSFWADSTPTEIINHTQSSAFRIKYDILAATFIMMIMAHYSAL
jgi:hypothetical protein